jgi:hypothetical protein
MGWGEPITPKTIIPDGTHGGMVATLTDADKDDIAESVIRRIIGELREWGVLR